jgi:hypothetical protein
VRLAAVICWPIVARAELTRTDVPVMTASPIISAAAVALVRFGLRIVLPRASRPIRPARPGSRTSGAAASDVSPDRQGGTTAVAHVGSRVKSSSNGPAVNVPPRAATRSRIPAMPRPAPGIAVRAALAPRPSSVIVTSTRSVNSSSTVTTAGPACLSTFVSDSCTMR